MNTSSVPAVGAYEAYAPLECHGGPPGHPKDVVECGVHGWVVHSARARRRIAMQHLVHADLRMSGSVPGLSTP